MRASPLQIEGYYVQSLSIKLDPKVGDRAGLQVFPEYHVQLDEPFEPTPINFRVGRTVGQHESDSSRWRYEIKIISQGKSTKNSPYNFDITLIGYFQVDEAYPADKAELLVHANAPALLYSAAREILAIVTGRGPFPALVLPSATFLDDAERMAATAAKKIGSGSTKKAVVKRTSKKASKKASRKKK